MVKKPSEIKVRDPLNKLVNENGAANRIHLHRSYTSKEIPRGPTMSNKNETLHAIKGIKPVEGGRVLVKTEVHK